MKKYGHLVTFVGQKYFNLTLPASCLSLNTPLHFYQLQRYIKAPKSEESSLQKGLSPSPNQGHSFSERQQHHPLQSVIRPWPFLHFGSVYRCEENWCTLSPKQEKIKKPWWMENKTFVIFRKENKRCSRLLPVKAEPAHTDAADF